MKWLRLAELKGRITYVGEDAVGYASRDPYKVKSSGDAIIRNQGDQLPTQTGIQSLQAALNPEDKPNQTYLPGQYFGDADVDGAMQKVFDAYLPRKLRGNANIKVDKDRKIVVTYNNAVIDVPGASGLEVKSTLGGGTSYEDINNAINKAANQIIDNENEILRTRGGGGALPSAY